MNILQQMSIWIFISLAASDLLQVVATAVETAGASSCGTECPSSDCFAGKCLFHVQDSDAEDKPVAQMLSNSKASPAPKAVATPSAIDLRQTPERQTVASGGTLFADEDAKPAPKALRSSETFVDGVAPLAAALPSPASVGGEVFGGGSGVAGGTGAHSKKLLELKAPLFRADLAFLSDEMQFMKQQLDVERSRGTALMSENSQLQKQLKDWRGAGTRVAEREGEVAKLLAMASREQNETTSRANTTAVFPVSFLGKMAPYAFSHAVTKFLVLGLLGSVVLLVWMQREHTAKLVCRTSEVKVSLRDIMYQVATCNKRCGRSAPFLRYFGVSAYAIEISEIHIGNVLVGGDVYVHLALGPDQEFHTPLVQLSDGAFLKFNAAFVIKVGKNDSPLVLSVIDKDPLMQDRVAFLEIPALELLRLAQEQQNREYYRFDLVPDSSRAWAMRGSESSCEAGKEERQPYTAMRIRDVTARAVQRHSASKDVQGADAGFGATSGNYAGYGSATAASVSGRPRESVRGGYGGESRSKSRFLDLPIAV